MWLTGAIIIVERPGCVHIVWLWPGPIIASPPHLIMLCRAGPVFN